MIDFFLILSCLSVLNIYFYYLDIIYKFILINNGLLLINAISYGLRDYVMMGSSIIISSTNNATSVLYLIKLN
jgi:hypothetical protein